MHDYDLGYDTDDLKEIRHMAATRRARGGRTAAPKKEYFEGDGVVTKIDFFTWNNKDLYNITVDGTKYGIGEGEPEDVYEGDTIEFDWYESTKVDKQGNPYRNMVRKSINVTKEGTGQTANSGSSASYDDTQNSIVMQACFKAAGELIGSAIGGGQLKIPAKSQYDTIMQYFFDAADAMYLKVKDSDNFPTAEGTIVDSIDDDDDFDDDVGDFDD